MRTREDKYLRLNALISDYRSRGDPRILLGIDRFSDLIFRSNEERRLAYLCRRVTGRLLERRYRENRNFSDLNSAIWSYEKASRLANQLNKPKAKLSLKRRIVELKKLTGSLENVAYSYFLLADAFLNLNRVEEAKDSMEEGRRIFEDCGGVPETAVLKKITEKYHTMVRQGLEHQSIRVI